MDADLDEESEPWVDPTTENVLRAAVGGSMPPRALASYARWWQLETWLRELVYLELRARYGQSWIEEVRVATGRLGQDAAYTHMAGADNDNPIAYLDYSQLVEVTARHWDLLGYALLERHSWDGRQDELKRVRHRIGHLRRPHQDDPGRLEQTLRDLERGAFIALASYNRRREPDPRNHDDPVTGTWLGQRHPTAQDLVRHAEERYGTRLVLRVSRRPWVRWPVDFEQAPGVLWHAEFLLRGRTVDPRALWRDSSVSAARPLLVHMLADDPSHVGFTFAAADEPQDVADAIGNVLDAVLRASQPGGFEDGSWQRWQRCAGNLDYRVMSGTGWNIVNEGTVPISLFGAGGGVQAAPAW